MTCQAHQRIGRLGLTGARGRLAVGSDVDSLLVALGEALNWMHSLQDLHRKRLTDKAYFGKQKSQADGQVLSGLIYARNLVHHQLATVMDLTDAYSDEYSDRYGVLHWLALDELPDPDKSNEHTPEQQQNYRQHLQGKEVEPTLEAGDRFLQQIAAQNP